jgi:hypothetical protein
MLAHFHTIVSHSFCWLICIKFCSHLFCWLIFMQLYSHLLCYHICIQLYHTCSVGSFSYNCITLVLLAHFHTIVSHLFCHFIFIQLCSHLFCWLIFIQLYHTCSAGSFSYNCITLVLPFYLNTIVFTLVLLAHLHKILFTLVLPFYFHTIVFTLVLLAHLHKILFTVWFCRLIFMQLCSHLLCWLI